MGEKELGLKINYDTKADVLYCSFGDPQEAISIEMDDGIILRLNPENDNVVGFTVVDFSKRFAEHPGRMLNFPLAPSVAFRMTSGQPVR